MKQWDKMTKEERDAYVNQDQVGLREIPWPDFNNKGVDYVWGNTTSPHLLIYQMYFLDKRPVSEIIEYVPCGKSQVYDIIKTLKDNIEDKSYTKLQKKILRLHFIEEVVPFRIQFKLRCGERTVYEYIAAHLFKYLPKFSTLSNSN